MTIESVGVSYEGNVNNVEKKYHDIDGAQSAGTVKNLQDSYVSSANENYYATYTSDGRINGDDVALPESEKSNVLLERHNSSKSCYICLERMRIQIIRTSFCSYLIFLNRTGRIF